MSEQSKGSTEIDKDPTAKAAAFLLANYHFDLGGYPAHELVERWLLHYPANWVRLAVIEALYQGRYKAISVEQILSIWKRRHLALYHFNYEFESLICSRLPAELTQLFSVNASDSSALHQEQLEKDRQMEHPPCHCGKEEKAAAISHPFEAIAPSPVKSTISLPEFPETQATQVSPLVEVESISSNPDSSLPPQPESNSDTIEGSQKENPEPVNTPILELSQLPIEELSPDPPFSDIFFKLRAIVLQHQEYLANSPENPEVETPDSVDVLPPETEERTSLPEETEIN